MDLSICEQVPIDEKAPPHKRASLSVEDRNKLQVMFAFTGFAQDASDSRMKGLLFQLREGQDLARAHETANRIFMKMYRSGHQMLYLLEGRKTMSDEELEAANESGKRCVEMMKQRTDL